MDDYCQIAVANLGMTGVASKVERAEIESAAVLPPKELSDPTWLTVLV